MYSTPVQVSNKTGETPAYRQPSAAEKLFKPQKISTLYENFQNGLRISGDKNCLGYRVGTGGYQWLSYKQVNERLSNFGSGLLQMRSQIFNKPVDSIGWHLGIYSVNRVEWVIAEQAANAYSVVTVALYDTLGAETLHYCINHSQLSIIVCSLDKVPNLLKVSGSCPCLKVILSMDSLKNRESANVLRQWAKEKQIILMGFDEVENLGRQKPLKHMPPKADDLATICYTSGTTGNPKGAMLINMNFIASGHSVAYHGLEIKSDDVMISYLPLAHCFERVLQVAMFNAGASIGFYRGDVLVLVEDIACLKPTIFPSVPRLFNRIYGKIVEATVKAPGLKGALCRYAYDSKLANLKNGGGLTHFLWDRLLFSKVQALLGGRVRLMITGSAPIAGEVLTFLRLVFSCEILEGYGQTECAAGSTITFPTDYVPSQVGAPLACNEIKLVDVPDMGYLSTDKPPRGEVCIRGYNVMTGYYNDEKKTRETIDSDGWLHTGDIGVITDKGCLAIIDRKKNLFKLAQGEYVAPEKLEVMYKESQYVMQSYVHGDSLQSVLVAIIVPDPEKSSQWSQKHLGKDVALPELCRNEDFKKFFLKELISVGRKMKLAGYEIAKNIYLEPEQFSVENDLLTPSFKLKRNVAIEKYRPIFNRLYSELSQEGNKAKL